MYFFSHVKLVKHYFSPLLIKYHNLSVLGRYVMLCTLVSATLA